MSSTTLTLLDSLSQIPGWEDPEPKAPAGKLGEAASLIIGLMKWGGLVGAVGALVAGGIMMIVGRRNRNQMAVDGAMSLPWVAGGLAMVLGATSLVGFMI